MPSIRTETETVIKKILPYLNRRGYDSTNDLDFEPGTESTVRYGKGYVDILVTCGKSAPSFLIEAKRSSKKLTVKDRDQAIDYGRSFKVPFVVVTNGADIQCFNTKNKEAIQWNGKLEGRIPSKDQLSAVVRHLRANKDATAVPLGADASLPFRPGLPLKQLNALFARCHNAVRKIEKNEEHAFADFSKLLFLKLLEEKGEASGDPLPYSYRFHELAERPEREADQIKDAVEKMISAIKRTRSYGEVLADPIHLKQPKTFRYIVRQLSSVSFEDSGLDYKGAAFEYFVRATLKGKKLGQYFTPRPLVELMSVLIGREAIVNAALANTPTKVLDPACGTGGFLVFLMKDALTQLRARLAARSISKALHDAALLRITKQIFFGADANEGVAAAAKMNMIIAGDGHTNIRAEDTLRENSTSWDATTPDCDYILTNPPFGTSESDSLPTSELSQYDVRSTKGQHLFLQKMAKSTVAGGLICTVIDEGVLNTDSAATIRKFLLQQCEPFVVLQLPDETFKPNKINVKSSVLLLRKREHADHDLQSESIVTFVRLHSLGYDGAGEKLRGFPFNELLRDFAKPVLDTTQGVRRSGAHWEAFDIAFSTLVKDPQLRLDLKYWEPTIQQGIADLVAHGALSIKELNKIETRRGKSPPSDVYVDENDGFALVVKAGSNISPHGLLVTNEADYVEKSVYDDLPDYCKLRRGDVLLSSTGDGTLGKSCVYELNIPAVADGHVTIIRVDPKQVYPHYLSDFLRCGFGAQQISRLFTGSTGLIELTPDRVEQLVVKLPPLADQKRVSEILRNAEQAFRDNTSRAASELERARASFAVAS